MKKIQLLYADPAWTFNDKLNCGNRGASHKYTETSMNDLLGPIAEYVNDVTDDNCFLAMWWVATQPYEALQVVDSWGFKLINMTGFTWHKLTKNGKDHFGMGHWTRANTENCLFARKGKIKRVNAGVRQLVHAKTREHSRKPDEIRDNLVTLMGDIPRMEMFARETTPGWEAWGNQTNLFS